MAKTRSMLLVLDVSFSLFLADQQCKTGIGERGVYVPVMQPKHRIKRRHRDPRHVSGAADVHMVRPVEVLEGPVRRVPHVPLQRGRGEVAVVGVRRRLDHVEHDAQLGLAVLVQRHVERLEVVDLAVAARAGVPYGVRLRDGVAASALGLGGFFSLHDLPLVGGDAVFGGEVEGLERVVHWHQALLVVGLLGLGSVDHQLLLFQDGRHAEVIGEGCFPARTDSREDGVFLLAGMKVVPVREPKFVSSEAVLGVVELGGNLLHGIVDALLNWCSDMLSDSELKEWLNYLHHGQVGAVPCWE